MKSGRLIPILLISALNIGCSGSAVKTGKDSVPAGRPAPAEKITEIKTHLLIGEDYQKKNPEWRNEVADVIKEINKRFAEEKIPVSLKITEIDTKSLNKKLLKKISAMKGDPVDNLSWYLYLEHFSEKELPREHIAIAIIQNTHRIRWGTAFYPKFSPHVAVISRPEDSECGDGGCFAYLTSLIMHEVCHLFGAKDIYEKDEKDFLMNSEMDFEEPPNFLIDEKNRKLILEALKTYYRD